MTGVCLALVVGGSSPHAGSRHHHPPPDCPEGGLIPARGESTVALVSRSASSRAHPRTRGVDSRGDDAKLLAMGSSPHAGSRPLAHLRVCDGAGLIPARGESTPSQNSARRRPQAHPRTRGVDTLLAGAMALCPGSSPHAGSRRGHGAWSGQGFRLIPARGESTRTPTRSSRSARAHPRTRGVDRAGGALANIYYGSSPHAGSRHAQDALEPTPTGLIPARGESTRSRSRAPLTARAHPRTRGVDVPATVVQERARGSSPHAGSRQHRAVGPVGDGGLIPARGESTHRRGTHPQPAGAHPRTRGVDPTCATCTPRRAGSSPHAGSRPARLPTAVSHWRLIPARGESTRTRRTARCPRRAHPRTRGVDLMGDIERLGGSGSSPHAGSRRSQVRWSSTRTGLIPARGESTVLGCGA